MEKCLLVTLPREVENVPFKYDDIIIKTYPIDTVYGMLYLTNITIDDIKNPIVQDISSLDWTKIHYMKIRDKVNIGTVKIRTDYSSTYVFSFNLDDLISCQNLSDIEFSLNGYQSMFGNISSLKNSTWRLAYIKLLSSALMKNNVNGNIKDIIGSNTVSCDIGILNNDGTIANCDIAELTESYRLSNLTLTNKIFYCSNRTVRNSQDYTAIAGRFNFENDIDIENFLISNSNCRWFYNNTNRFIITTIEIIKENYTPSEDAIDAIQKLKSNMYLKSTSTKRTPGTYFTVKINGVVQ